MSQPCGPLMVSYYMLAGISFLNAMVGMQFIVPVLVAPCPLSSHYTSIVEYSTSGQCSQQGACMVWMGYITSWVSQFAILNSCIARALVRVFIRIVTTVGINC